MDKRAVFITGGTSGMGLELAKLYSEEGHNVAVCSVETESTARKVIPTDVLYYQVDVREKDEVKRSIDNFQDICNGLDLVLANAGISMKKEKIPDFERGRSVINTNVIGVMNTFEAALEYMIPQKSGHLMAMSSIAAFRGQPGMAIYSASKAAVLIMCESFAIDLKKYGISVSTFAPGFVDTPLTEVNNHKMPFLINQQRAAKIIKKSLDQKKDFTVFPIPMKLLSLILKYLPRPLYIKIMRIDPFGFSKTK